MDDTAGLLHTGTGNIYQVPGTRHGIYLLAPLGSPVDALYQLEPIRLAEVRPSREKTFPSSR